MERVQMYLTKQEKITLKEEAEKTGLSMAEILRRILDKHIKKLKNK